MDDTFHPAATPGARLEGKGMDLDPSRRPGVPHEHDPKPLPNAKWPIEPQKSEVPVFMHGRPNKTFPPVFGTAVPPKGLSGKIRAAAYSRPDHETVHWLLLLLSDRVDVWEHRFRKYGPFAVGIGALYAAGTVWQRQQSAAERAKKKAKRLLRR
jgi:hypothetical protein